MDEFADDIARMRVSALVQDEETVEGLEEALLAWGPDAPRVGRAAVLLDRGETQEALGELARVQLIQPPARAYADRLRAQANLEAGDPAAALSAIDGQTSDDAQVLRAQALFRLRRVDEARDLVRDVLSRDPDHWEARYGEAVMDLATGGVKNAMHAFRGLQQDNPLDLRPYRGMAKILLLTGQADEGIGLLRGLIDNPLLGAPPLAMELAELYAAAGRGSELPEVLEAVTRTARIGQPQALALATLWQEVPSSGAIRHLWEAFSNTPIAPVLDALALEVEGRDDEALSAFLAASDLNHWLVHERIAAHLLARGDRDRALRHLARAEQLAPRTAAVKLTRAVADLATNPDAALKALQMAAQQPAFRETVRRRAQLALQAWEADA